MVVHSFKSLRSTSADAAAAEPPIILDVLEEALTPKIVSKREEQQTQKTVIPCLVDSVTTVTLSDIYLYKK